MTAIHSQLASTSKALRQRGCGPYSCVNALVAASGGQWAPKPATHATSSANARVARSGIGKAFSKRGLRPSEVFASMQAVVATDVRMDVPVQHRSGVKVTALLEQLRRTGSVAIVAVDYATVQAAGKGVTSFRGFHWVTVLDEVGSEVVVADPLRRRTVRWPTSLLAKAMERFGTRPWLLGRGEAIVVGPWRTWRQGYAGKAAEAKAAKNEADALRKALAACEARP